MMTKATRSKNLTIYIPEEDLADFELFEKDMLIRSKNWPEKLKNPKRVMNAAIRKLVKSYVKKNIKQNETNTTEDTETD